MRHELKPIADAQHSGTRVEDFWIDRGAPFVVNTGGTAGDDQPFAVCEGRSWSLTRQDLGVYTKIPHFSRDQVAILAAGIEYRDLRCGDGNSAIRHFDRRFTITRFAES